MKVIKSGLTRKEIECPYCKANLIYCDKDIKKEIPSEEPLRETHFRRSKLQYAIYRCTDRIECPECGKSIIIKDYYKSCLFDSAIRVPKWYLRIKKVFL